VPLEEMKMKKLIVFVVMISAPMASWSTCTTDSDCMAKYGCGGYGAPCADDQVEGDGADEAYPDDGQVLTDDGEYLDCSEIDDDNQDYDFQYYNCDNK
jgi:hypothetical protein